MTASPCFFARGRDSPVRSDSSTVAVPRTTMPSAGIFSPPFTTNSSPG